MKNNILGLIFLTILSFSFEVAATNMQASYIKDLKAIHKVEKSSNKLLGLIRESSVELSKDWSPELAGELARVFNELLNVDQNFFLVELIEPVFEKHEKEFRPIFEKKLSKENLKAYGEMLKMDKREEAEGNG